MINNNGWERSWVMAGFGRSVYETARPLDRGLIRVGPITVFIFISELRWPCDQNGFLSVLPNQQNRRFEVLLVLDGPGQRLAPIDIHIVYSLFVEIWFFLVPFFFGGCFFRLICFFSFLLGVVGVVYQIKPWPDRIGQINGRAWRDCNCSIPISWGKFFVHCHFQS